MKVIKHGAGKRIKEKKRIKCGACGCKYIATNGDTSLGNTVLGIPAYYTSCPDCEHRNFYTYKY